MSETAYFWTIIFCLAIGTISIRFSIIGIASRFAISERVKAVFSYIPAAILPALIVPAVFFHEGEAAWALGKERALVLALAAFVCYASRSTLATISFGLASLYLVRLVS